MSPRAGLFIAVALSALPALAAAFAYTAQIDGKIVQNKNTGQHIVWYIPRQSISLNFGGAYDSSAKSAMDEWNAVGASLQYQTGSITAQPCNGSDHINSGGWSFVTCSNQPFGDAIALTRRNYEQIGGVWYLSDADIVFDQARSWNPHYTGPLRSTQDFRRVILHELGHAFGLDHPDDAGQTVDAIMNSHTSDIDTLQPDDKNGILALYPIPTASANDSTDQTAQSGGGGGGGSDPAVALLALAALLTRRGRKILSAGARAPALPNVS